MRTILGSSSQELAAACSPVTDELVYVTNKRGAWELWIASLSGTGDRVLAPQAEVQGIGPTNPVFLAGGRRVAFVRANGGRNSILVKTIDGGPPVVVDGAVTGAANAYAPTWSPDGNRLAFYTPRGPMNMLLVTARVGGSDPPLELGESGAVRLPVPEWSPTGEWVAFRDLESRLALVSPEIDGPG